MVARLKLKGIDGRAHQEWSLRLNLTNRPSGIDEKILLVVCNLWCNKNTYCTKDYILATLSNCREFSQSQWYRSGTVRSGQLHRREILWVW
jgi:hypothetical protein